MKKAYSDWTLAPEHMSVICGPSKIGERMKALVLHGSPRRGGSSDTLVEHFLKGLNKSGSCTVNEFFTNDLNIKPCQMCESCSRPPNYTCIIKDDMYKIYSAFREADLVVFATPMLWGYMTAQLKTVLDRMEAIASEKYLRGKTFVVIVTYRHHYESTVAFFKRAFADYFGVKLHTVLYCSMDKSSGQEAHVSTCKEKLSEACDLGRSLGRQLGSRTVAKTQLLGAVRGEIDRD